MELNSLMQTTDGHISVGSLWINFIFSFCTAIPPIIANLSNLEILNLSNNHLEELPVSISSMAKLRILNCSINRLGSLPR